MRQIVHAGAATLAALGCLLFWYGLITGNAKPAIGGAILAIIAGLPVVIRKR